MKRIIYILSAIFCITACTKDNFINTGVSNGRHEGKNMLEYMETSSYDWDSTLILIHHAGDDVVRLFEGNDPDHKEFTFFGIANHSIRRYLLKNKIKRVADLDAEWCRSILLQHVVDGKLYRKDIPEGKPGDFGTVGTGGVNLETLAGTKIWVYTVPQVSGAVTENVAHPIFINFTQVNKLVAVASGDIEPDNCLVHTLEYAYTLGDVQ